MNWGQGIALTMIAFVAFITTLAVIIMRQDVDLVSEQYYADEVACQANIEAQNREQLSKGVEIAFNNGSLNIHPLEADVDSMTVHFYRPNDAKRDFYVRGENQLSVSSENLLRGRYELEIKYFKDNEMFLKRQEIYVP